MSITDLIVHFGDIIELNDLHLDIQHIQKVLDESLHWVQYNPRKQIKRYGLSVTSVDGGYSGIPDLDSLREYNMLNGTAFTEKMFRKRTPICDELNLNPLLNMWEPWLGRAHFLKLDAGGFFPPHRDNGLSLPPNTIRILIPIRWKKGSAVWIQDGQILDLEEGKGYFVNTTKNHHLFSYTDNSYLLVLNVMTNPETIHRVAGNAKIL